MIYQRESQVQNSIVFYDNINNGLSRYGRYVGDFLDAAFSLFQNVNRNQLNDNDFFNQLRIAGGGNAPVYALTYLFFISKGVNPIYDRFTWLATEGLMHQVAPKRQFEYKESIDWQRYEEYKKRLVKIFGNFNIDRDTDRALYAYGHFFKTAGANGGCGDGGNRNSNPLKSEQKSDGERLSVVANNHTEIQFRTYSKWIGLLPEHDSLITLHFGENWVTCALGDKSNQFWTKAPQETNFGKITWRKFFNHSNIQNKQRFSVDVLDNEEFELTSIS